MLLQWTTALNDDRRSCDDVLVTETDSAAFSRCRGVVVARETAFSQPRPSLYLAPTRKQTVSMDAGKV